MSLKQASPLEERILSSIYENRAMTLEQLSKLQRTSKATIYNSISSLKKRGYLNTEGATGIKRNQSTHNQGKFAFLTDKGISLLRQLGYEATRQAIKNKPTKKHLPYVLLMNDIRLSINERYWTFLNARDAKVYFGRKTKEYLDGAILNKEDGSTYCLYVMLPLSKNEEPSKVTSGILMSTMSNHYAQMKTVIRNMEHHQNKTIHQYIIFCKDQRWYEHLLKSIPKLEKGRFLPKVTSLRLLPFEVGQYLIKTFQNKATKERFANDLIELSDKTKEKDLSFKTNFKMSDKEFQYGIDFTISYENGEEYYGVNMVDMDIKKLFRLKRISNDEYEKLGKKKIKVFATEFNAPILYKEINYPYIDFEILTVYDVVRKIENY